MKSTISLGITLRLLNIVVLANMMAEGRLKPPWCKRVEVFGKEASPNLASRLAWTTTGRRMTADIKAMREILAIVFSNRFISRAFTVRVTFKSLVGHGH